MENIWFTVLVKLLKLISLLVFFGGHKPFLWGHWYPCFGFPVKSPLGFKARGGSLIYTWQRHMNYILPEIHLWCNTCQPLGSQQAAKPFSSMYLWAGIGGAWKWDLLCHHNLTVWDQADALPTELCRLGVPVSFTFQASFRTSTTQCSLKMSQKFAQIQFYKLH